ncbi:ABC-type sugar transport system, substrate-binding protein, contains N-terminal xre family HTH domain [Desulfocicer vacuolatum DSM 3385]|uniref:ABC-type sugar transport system, substrate-binding protein, contains N-terminal xre family HTH domain n=1 Tax=Desulfocicer vacuolatum DSM 3385 TaxID=1121400 RepID=A0A1W2DH14_9BACT|nr:substrate-binding domain-containing protein [Desulfocicer vacuolatum]SMC96266.1 ABC-type sugar transport system, substrate-binding protein, contains N-terminal xre family HTH domain [Desulfocicer vacuolatum DSM 3385]
MKIEKYIKKIRISFVAVFLSFVFHFIFFLPHAEAGNERTVALVMKALSNPFFSKMEEGAKKYAMEEDIPLEVFGVERETDVERQIGICDNLISRGYGAIVIAPADSKKLVPICKKAMEKNIIVINIDNPLHKKTMKQMGISIPFVGSDNYTGAGMVGTYIKKKLDGQGDLIVIEGIRGVENAELRKNGFIETVTRDSKIRIVGSESANWHTDEALFVTTGLLKKHKNINAIFCANDQMALGALQAIDIMGLTGTTLLAGYDNIELARDHMHNGRIHATIEQHPEQMGEYGVQLAWQALNDQKISFYKSTSLDLITHESFNKTIGLSVSTLQTSFFLTLLKGAQEAADLYGLTLIVKDAQNSDSQQLSDIVDLLEQDVDILMVNPTNTESVMPGIGMANKKAVPIISVDRKTSGGKILCHIESDNVEGGRMAAEILARYFKEGARVIEIEGIPGTSACYERGVGFNKELQKYPQIKVVARDVANFDRKEAREVMLRILQGGEGFDAVFAHNDDMILGVIDALKKFNYGHSPLLIGFDALPEAKKAIHQDELNATIAQQPELMGKLSIETAVRYFRGEKVKPKLFVDLSVISK